jgi:hypothetical protein
MDKDSEMKRLLAIIKILKDENLALKERLKKCHAALQNKLGFV